MDKQARLVKWQEAQDIRTHSHTPLKVVLSVLARGIVAMGRGNAEAKWYLLRAMRRGKRGVLEWLLGWIRVLFLLVGHGLAQSRFRQQ